MRIREHGWTLALDAMGVLYRYGDDVADLLIPFVANHGGIQDEALIQALYHRASLGAISASEFWEALGLSPSLEDAYLAQHQLIAGVVPFLEFASGIFDAVCCASNDVSEWSLKLRRRFRLEDLIGCWFTSGDLGVRKPDPSFFHMLVAAVGAEPARIMFVDDRVANVAAAAAAGLHSVLFGVSPAGVAFPSVKTYDELNAYVTANLMTSNQ